MSKGSKLAPGGGGTGAWIGGPDRPRGAEWTPAGEADADRRWKSSPNSVGELTEIVALGLIDCESSQKIAAAGTGTSIFDPVLTELIYRWFCPPSGRIVDPFAGGSVRGIVASKLGYAYVGIELRPEQLAANQAQADRICAGDAQPPVWLEGDSLDLMRLIDGPADLIFTCPPYGDLEIYSDDPRDLSSMSWAAFSDAYRRIIAASVALLRPDRFACYVVGDIRDKRGLYRGLPELTVAAFAEAGAAKYNEAVLLTAVGSLPVRAGKQFEAGRKLGKTHQNVLVFLKGDPKKAAKACRGPEEEASAEKPEREVGRQDGVETASLRGADVGDLDPSVRQLRAEEERTGGR